MDAILLKLKLKILLGRKRYQPRKHFVLALETKIKKNQKNLLVFVLASLIFNGAHASSKTFVDFICQGKVSKNPLKDKWGHNNCSISQLHLPDGKVIELQKITSDMQFIEPVEIHESYGTFRSVDVDGVGSGYVINFKDSMVFQVGQNAKPEYSPNKSRFFIQQQRDGDIHSHYSIFSISKNNLRRELQLNLDKKTESTCKHADKCLKGTTTEFENLVDLKWSGNNHIKGKRLISKNEYEPSNKIEEAELRYSPKVGWETNFPTTEFK